MRAILAVALPLLAGAGAAYAFSLHASAKREGFRSLFERRAAHASGILAPGEWRSMQALYDLRPPADGGGACRSPDCAAAERALGGRWRIGADCAAGSVYRFTDGAAIVEDVAEGRVTGASRRRYRLVASTVPLQVWTGGDGRPIDIRVEKRAGDLEVWTLGASAYVRRILRRTDADTVRLVLVQHRIGAGPVLTLYADGRSTVDRSEAAYRRCPS